jgi:hypothetical protein
MPRGDNQKALELVSASADLDASMNKHPTTPAEVLPARELLDDLPLELNQPAAALKEYEQTVKAEHNRFRSILEIARACKQTGDMPKAREAYETLVALAVGDTDRPNFSRSESLFSELIKAAAIRSAGIKSARRSVDPTWPSLDSRR